MDWDFPMPSLVAIYFIIYSCHTQPTHSHTILPCCAGQLLVANHTNSARLCMQRFPSIVLSLCYAGLQHNPKSAKKVHFLGIAHPQNAQKMGQI